VFSPPKRLCFCLAFFVGLFVCKHDHTEIVINCDKNFGRMGLGKRKNELDCGFVLLSFYGVEAFPALCCAIYNSLDFGCCNM